MSESRCTWCGMLSEGDHAPNCPVGEAKKLRARNAELERQLAEENERKKAWENLASDYANKNLELAQRSEQAEQRISESQRQEPVIEVFLPVERKDPSAILWDKGLSFGRHKLYCIPIVPPTVEEAVKAEREACAKIAMSHIYGPSRIESADDLDNSGDIGTCYSNSTAEDIANAIRTRRDK